MKTRYWSIAAVGLLVLVAAYRLPRALSFTPRDINMHVLQAEAFLQGQLNLPDYTVDAAVYNDRLYAPFPPMPALLLTPVVAAFGSGSNAVAVALAMAGVTCLALLGVLRRLGMDMSAVGWLSAAFLLGTGYWTSVLISFGVWNFAHVAAVMFLMMAILESMGKARGWLVGVLLGAAFLSRQFTILAAPILALEVLQGRSGSARPGGKREIAWMTAGVGLFAAAYLLFNYFRFGSPFDTGYIHILHADGFLKDRFVTWGLFSPAYVPYNLIQVLLSGFGPEFSGDCGLSGFKTSEFGTGLITASPWVLLMFFAGWRNSRVRAAVLTCAAIAVIQLFYYNNGWIQVNAHRFTLDFLPIAMIPVAIGFREQAERGQAALWKWAIGWSVLLNALAFYLYRPLNQFLDWWLTVF